MQQSPSKFASGQRPLYLDTSVLINMVATGCAPDLFKALNQIVCVENTALNEFYRNPIDGSPSKPLLDELIRNKNIIVHSMSDDELVRFISLTAGTPPDDLGDGEAATLASAIPNGIAAIDDRKAIRVSAKLFPLLQVLGTLDLIAANSVIQEMGLERVIRAIEHARTYARMRVPHSWKCWLSYAFSECGKDLHVMGC